MSTQVRILVFGGTSFLGQSLIAALKENSSIEVGNVSRSIVGFENVKNYHYDTDFDFIYKDFNPDKIIYLSCFYNNNDTQGQIQVMLTKPLEIIEYLGMNNKHTIFYSIGSYWQLGSQEVPLVPIDKYSCAKKALSSYMDYYNQYTNVKCIEVVLFGTYGFNDKRKKIIDLIIDSKYKEVPLKISKGEQLLNLSYIDDVVNSLCNLLMITPEIKKYLLLCEKSYRLKEIVEIIKNHTVVNISIGSANYRKNEIMIPNFSSNYYHITMTDRIKWFLKEKINENK